MSKDDGRFSTVIRVDLREGFFDEKKPGRLVNDLLEEHYGKPIKKIEPNDGALSKPVEDTTFARPKVVWCRHGNVTGFCKKGCK